MIKCEGYFDRYEFHNNCNKIYLCKVKSYGASSIQGAEVTYHPEVYFEALDIPELIGALSPLCRLEWECTEIRNMRIYNPLNIIINNI